MYTIQTNASGTRSIDVSEENLETIRKYALFQQLIDSTGIIDGIAASETANNAATGGAMVPLLSLGIPGGNAAAVMMSALTLKGVQLGPLLLTNQPTYLSATFMSMIVTNILMVIVAMAIAKVFAQILAIPYSYLGPIIMMLALIGTYGDQMSATSVQIMVLSGILGLIVRACHLNSAAIVLGLVLGSTVRRTSSNVLTGRNVKPFFTASSTSYKSGALSFGISTSFIPSR